MSLLSTATRFLLARAMLMIILITSFPIVHAATLSLTYDANGNLITGDGKYRVYDGYNQLRYVYNGSNTSVLLQEYEYHPVEERVLSKKTYLNNGSLEETIIYFSKQHVRVINSSGSYDFTYIYHEGQLVAQVNPDGSKIFIHSDHLGSSTVVTNSTGDVIENTTYTPHGEILSGGEEVRYGYEAKEHDTVVGDTDFNARKYKAEWGLFLQADTKLQDVYDPQFLNRYAFERNNPFIYVDPTGRDAWLLVAPNQAGGNGHVALIIGNNKEYYAYTQYANTDNTGGYSVLVRSFPGKVEINGPYESPDDALASINRQLEPYEDAIHYETDDDEDKAMREEALAQQELYASGDRRYQVIFSNCADFTTDVLRAGNVNIREGTRPNTYFANEKERLAQKEIQRRSSWNTWNSIAASAKARFNKLHGSSSGSSKDDD